MNYTLPPQQILQANGKASIDAIRMAPNHPIWFYNACKMGISYFLWAICGQLFQKIANIICHI